VNNPVIARSPWLEVGRMVHRRFRQVIAEAEHEYDVKVTWSSESRSLLSITYYNIKISGEKRAVQAVINYIEELS